MIHLSPFGLTWDGDWQLLSRMTVFANAARARADGKHRRLRCTPLRIHR